MLVRNHGRHEGSPPGRSGPVTATQCGRRFQSTDYISGVSGLDDRAVADGFWGVGGVARSAGCEAAAGCFFWALVAAALRAAALRSFTQSGPQKVSCPSLQAGFRTFFSGRHPSSPLSRTPSGESLQSEVSKAPSSERNAITNR